MTNFNPSETMPLSEIQQLRAAVNEVMTALNNQRDMLRLRGMDLPPGTEQNLKNIDEDLAGLEKRLASEETELLQLRSLAATSAMVNSSLDLDTVLTSAMDEMIKLVGAERGYIILRDPQTGVLDYRVARDLDAGYSATSNVDFQGSSTVLNEVLTTSQPLLTDNAYKDPRMQNNMSIATMSLRSVLCVPLNYKGDTVGAVYVDNRLRTGVFSERELNLLVTFANQSAVAIENARLFARVQSNLIEITDMRQLMGNVFDSVGSGVITTNGENQVTTFNPAAADILACAPEQAIGHPLQAVLPKVSADFDEHVQDVRETYQPLTIKGEAELQGKGRVALSLKLNPLRDSRRDEQDFAQGLAIVVDDLTEQQEREEKLNIMGRYLPPAMIDNIRQIAEIDLGGERREVTCMFVDVRPIYSFPADPHQMMEMLNEYLTVATDCIHSTNGIIDKYNGNEVMVLFNSQFNPHADHPLRAIDAALQMREVYQELYRRHGIDPQPHYYRVGIHSGVATLGNVGSINRRDFTALGDTINLSHRILENARPGQITISEDCLNYLERTSQGIPDHLRFEEREAIKAKGRQQYTPIYEVYKA
ncbi:MAG: GAF domain-containing protein [Anaerolineaceae bacterium]|nr:GAF domain-containing protein [Anaerolineaceae bacterium]